MNTLKNIIEQANSLLPQYCKQEVRELMFMLFDEVLHLSRTQILSNQDAKVSISDYNQIINLTKRLKNNEPIQYILGKTEFYNLHLKVNKNVLIPRPETEELVEMIIKINTKKTPKILDLATGSGCIAIALNKNISESNVFACDFSSAALKVAEENNVLNQTKVNFFSYDILIDSPLNLPHQIDVLVSNPPYILPQQRKQMEANVLDYEPHNALFVSANNPLVFYKKIADIGKEILNTGAYLFFEINEVFGKQVFDLMVKSTYRKVSLHKDLNGKDRIIKAIL